jgi:hypothetical protein
MWKNLDTPWHSGQLLAKRLRQGVDQAVERLVAPAQILDLLERVDHGRMVFATEALSDLWQ